MHAPTTATIVFLGLIHCQILEGSLKDAALQLELLDELVPTIGVSAVGNSVICLILFICMPPFFLLFGEALQYGLFNVEFF